MKEKRFQELLESLREAKGIMLGKRPPSRQFRLETVDVKQSREGLGLSQRDFALLLGVSVETVRRWERDQSV